MRDDRERLLDILEAIDTWYITTLALTHLLCGTPWTGTFQP